MIRGPIEHSTGKEEVTVDQDVAGAAKAGETVDRVASLPLLASVPREEIAWLIERAELREHRTGDVLRTAGATIEEMSMVLSGRVAVYVKRGGAWRRMVEVEAGYVLGVVPYSRAHAAPGNVIAEADSKLLILHRKHFPGLVRECPEITAALVHHMIDRARDFRTMEMHDERLLALGKLASGLAHELNNPASGASTGARSLTALLNEAESASRALAAAGLSDVQLDALDAVRAECARTGPQRSALDASDREEEFTEWLELHDADPAAAVALANTNVNLSSLNALGHALPADALGVALRWLASASAARDVARQIHTATARIHDLVNAVKGFTFMDREGVPEDVDVAQGLAHTIAMLESKCRAKSVDLQIETAADLPGVYGYGSEINQVWEKLIDNAIDAVDRGGSVTITATGRSESIVVRIVDNGPGIPDEIRPRVFDPFFTTKQVGSGTGLGLHQARRIVQMHYGEIDVTSRPGRTVFRVWLPVTGTMGVRAQPGSRSE